MSFDGKRCECGSAALGMLRRRDERHGEPICGHCLSRIAPSGRLAEAVAARPLGAAHG